MLKFPDLTEVTKFKWYHKPKISKIHSFKTVILNLVTFGLLLNPHPLKGIKVMNCLMLWWEGIFEVLFFGENC